MSGLLVSVRNAREAVDALAAGVDLIDLKEPRDGALAPIPKDELRRVVQVVRGAVPLSAALGELRRAEPEEWRRLPPEIRYAKVGLAGCGAWPDWPARWQRALACLPASVAAVAVIYADAQSQAPPPEAVLAVGLESGCRAILIDTFDKSQGGLFAHLAADRVERLVAATRAAGRLSVLGGSLSLETLPQAVHLGCDLVAVRGAVCGGSREQSLCRQRLEQVVELLERLGRQRHPAVRGPGRFGW